MANRLELTWVGKDQEMKLEPRILIENPRLSNTEKDKDTENMLIHGDNLLALKALESKYAGKIKCIYIDPPYNISAMNEYYNDFVEHSMWLNRIRPRIELLRELLCEDGVIFIQISDEEQAYLKILCDEVFGRSNFVNMVSVNMKNIAGASGGGEDKRLKKNCEYILIYAKDYNSMPLFNGPYEYTELSTLIQQYIDEGKSWKYTTVLVDPGEKDYIGSTVDGDGNEIKVYRRINPIMLSIKQIAKQDGITEKEAYQKYGINIFQTTNAQSSIRTRIIDYRREMDIRDDLLSIEYVPRTGKNKGCVYEQFYKGDKCRLFVWLRDTSTNIDGELYKVDQLGTYWDMNAWMKNVSKEGNVDFPNSKKPEKLISQIIEMCTQPNDIVLDSFLGSGTTAATAHKLGRRYIGVEMGDHAYSLCKPRLDRVIANLDNSGISKATNWQGGGGYRFYELAPSLIVKDKFGNPVINKEYNADMLAAAMALHEGFVYSPDENFYWKQGKNENAYIYTTTVHLTEAVLDAIAKEMKEDEYLVIACKSYDSGIERAYKNIKIKKIPQFLLGRCEFGKDNYNLNIVDVPVCGEEDDE